MRSPAQLESLPPCSSNPRALEPLPGALCVPAKKGGNKSTKTATCTGNQRPCAVAWFYASKLLMRASGDVLSLRDDPGATAPRRPRLTSTGARDARCRSMSTSTITDRLDNHENHLARYARVEADQIFPDDE